MRSLAIAAAVGVLLVAHQGFAMFRSGDVVVVPVAAATQGLHSSNWRTDLEILNVGSDPVDIRIALLPSGGADNQVWFDDFSRQLGWSSDFGHYLPAPPPTDPTSHSPLAQIQPGELVTLDDVLSNWGLDGVKGALVVFAYKTGTFTTTDPAAAIAGRIVVNSRTYSLSEGSDGSPRTFGQQVPGLPWHGFTGSGDPAAAYSRVTFAGVREDDSYRTALGLVNLSDRLTTIEVTLNASDGTALATRDIVLEPFAHLQFDRAIRSLFEVSSDQYPSVVGATATAAVKGWEPAVGAGDPTPAFIAYGSRIDNQTNDPVYLEPSYDSELPWDCVFNGANCPAAQSAPPSVIAMFRAASMVVIPEAASTAGLNSSNWHTDLEIRNVDSVPIDLEIVFLPTGGASNAVWYFGIANALGGRSEDGFGHVDAKLKDIPPGGTVLMDDVVNATWGAGLKGALVIWAFEANTFTTTTPKGGTPRDVVVTSRTYSLGTTTDGKATTYGQQVPALPWYDYIDPQQKAKGYDEAVLPGIRGDTLYRTSVGLVNVSDILTSLSVELVLKAADGTVLKDLGITLLPLAHVQYDNVITGLFGLPSDSPVIGASLTVKVPAWQSTANAPTPALLAYASRMDNATNDPVYIEQTWANELPWDCVFNGGCVSATGSRLNSTGRAYPLVPPTP
ncbi:MAG: hypothetical protein ACM3O7_04135 [Acidobacteriota bacterium]